jgi:hypothetical protein
MWIECELFLDECDRLAFCTWPASIWNLDWLVLICRRQFRLGFMRFRMSKLIFIPMFINFHLFILLHRFFPDACLLKTLSLCGLLFGFGNCLFKGLFHFWNWEELALFLNCYRFRSLWILSPLNLPDPGVVQPVFYFNLKQRKHSWLFIEVQ